MTAGECLGVREFHVNPYRNPPPDDQRRSSSRPSVIGVVISLMGTLTVPCSIMSLVTHRHVAFAAIHFIEERRSEELLDLRKRRKAA